MKSIKKQILNSLKNVLICKFNVPNRNGRIYTSECFNLNDTFIKERLKTHAFFGEINPKPEKCAEINLKKIPFDITALYKRKNGLYADIDILNPPQGRILNKIINDGIGMGGFRPCGYGDLHLKGDSNTVINYVLNNIHFFTNAA